jgi:Protein of unknown function (DUF3892)
VAIRVCISCITKIPRTDPRKRVHKVGGTNVDGSRWKLREDQAISRIEDGTHSFYVSVGWRNEDVVVATHSGHKYLKTTADGDQPDNLLSLPECP